MKINSVMKAFNPLSPFEDKCEAVYLKVYAERYPLGLAARRPLGQTSDLKPVNHQEINWNDYTLVQCPLYN